MLRDTLLGRIFQKPFVIEVLKQRCNNGYDANLYFFRDSNGSKIYLLCKTSNRLVGIETRAVFTRYGKFAKQHVGFAVKTNRLIKVWLSIPPPYLVFKVSTALVSSRFFRDRWGAVDKWVDILDALNIPTLKTITFTFPDQFLLILDVFIQNHGLSNDLKLTRY